MGVAAHRRFIDADLPAAGGDERFELSADEREEGLGKGPAVLVLIVREEAAGEGVGAGDGGLKAGMRGEG
jgi:hypothetical protein